MQQYGDSLNVKRLFFEMALRHMTRTLESRFSDCLTCTDGSYAVDEGVAAFGLVREEDKSMLLFLFWLQS